MVYLTMVKLGLGMINTIYCLIIQVFQEIFHSGRILPISTHSHWWRFKSRMSRHGFAWLRHRLSTVCESSVYTSFSTKDLQTPAATAAVSLLWVGIIIAFPRTKSDVCLPHWLLGSLAAAFSSGDNSSWSWHPHFATRGTTNCTLLRREAESTLW